MPDHKSPRPYSRVRPSRKRRAGAGSWLRLGASAVLLASLAGAVWLASLARTLPELSGLEPAPSAGAIVLLDRHGRTIVRRGEAGQAAIRAGDLPGTLVDAVLAVEDRRFYSHFGVDLIGAGRAALANMRAGRVVQGGSTITQQLAKNLFLTPDRTLERKVQEMMLAFWLEQRFTKDEILALYLNRVYFGAGAWGAEDAAQRYFSKSAHELTLGEAALLAGLLKAPSRYAPTSDARRASVRATVVLDLMLAAGRITEAERIAAAEAPIRVSRGNASPGAGWFADWVLPQVRELAPGHTGDLVVRTTLDIAAQRAAEQALREGLNDPALARGAGTGALAALDHTGAVVAMAGGADYVRSPFNRAVSARRQPGSAFKPFVYAAGFEGGLTPDDVFEDQPVRYGSWAPENFNNRYEGPMTLETAFARSSNAVAVQVSETTGRGWVLRTARRMGVTSPIQNTASAALGAYEVTPLELIGAYLPFMNGGRAAEPYAITAIEAPDGRVIWAREDAPGPVVLAGRVAADMDRIFAAAVETGTGRSARVPGREVRGKTGTTNGHRDAWFAGWSEGMAAVVWMGNDDFSPTQEALGGAGPAQVFARFINAAPVYPAPLDALLIEPARRDDPIAALLEMPAPAPEPDPEPDGDDPIAALLGRMGGD
ncbi:PBP1A family penicillin-binding protein [Alkalicaulis satelles]|uniref:PBP1A family penicillin-binding protein n=1 Tax=Alkalicaulis satelles TaxID=2609175 RepID=A0A5M6ZJ30_9PROT|nr:PBP1A family penicillin-binding protein [Alkalicaulis satelles]KAA5804015.1 PBP1A family penicillin-binding protein [Alkalicaulis satelles]